MVVGITYRNIRSFSRDLIDRSIDTSIDHGECLGSVGDGSGWIGDDRTGCIMIELWDGVGMGVMNVRSGDTVGWGLFDCSTACRSSKRTSSSFTGPGDGTSFCRKGWYRRIWSSGDTEGIGSVGRIRVGIRFVGSSTFSVNGCWCY